jgi:hypothetical protein
MLSSHVVSCGSAICPIILSTASVAMKLPFGVKPRSFFLASTIWIAASHRKECGVSVLAIDTIPFTPNSVHSPSWVGYRGARLPSALPILRRAPGLTCKLKRFGASNIRLYVQTQKIVCVWLVGIKSAITMPSKSSAPISRKSPALGKTQAAVLQALRVTNPPR